MAHLRRRANGNWIITIEKGVSPLTGKRERLYKTIPNSKNMNKAEAEKEMAKILVELDEGSYVEPENITLGEFLLSWLEDECQPNLAPRSYEKYEEIMVKHIIPVLGRIPLQKLQPVHIKRYQALKLKSGRLDGKPGGLSNKSVRMHIHTLSQALKYAVGLQLLKSNPCEHVKAPKVKKTNVNFLEENEVNILLRYIKEHGKAWDYVFFSLAIFTGMRRGELAGLSWDDIDFKNSKIYVRRVLQRIRGQGLVLQPYPKTDHGWRNIDISQQIVDLLKEHKKDQIKQRLQYGEGYQDNNLVFCNEDGSFVNPGSITRRFNNYLERAGVKKIRLHDLRHTHASLLLKAGVQPKVVQERLGHSSITITMDMYSHLFPSIQKEAAQRLDNMFNI